MAGLVHTIGVYNGEDVEVIVVESSDDGGVAALVAFNDLVGQVFDSLG